MLWPIACVVLGLIGWDMWRRWLALRASHRDELQRAMEELRTQVNARLDAYDERIRDVKNMAALNTGRR